MGLARRSQPAAPAPPPPAAPKQRPASDIAAERLQAFIAKGRDLAELAAALRACKPAERALLGASVPFTTGTTGARCDQLRALFAGIDKEV